MKEREIKYRRMKKIKEEWGKEVNVKEMVLGNMGEKQDKGVELKRKKQKGEKKIYGELIVNEKGEEVVEGISKKKKIKEEERIEEG